MSKFGLIPVWGYNIRAEAGWTFFYLRQTDWHYPTKYSIISIPQTAGVLTSRLASATNLKAVWGFVFRAKERTSDYAWRLIAGSRKAITMRASMRWILSQRRIHVNFPIPNLKPQSDGEPQHLPHSRLSVHLSYLCRMPSVLARAGFADPARVFGQGAGDE